jgi:hypothetical protein
MRVRFPNASLWFTVIYWLGDLTIPFSGGVTARGAVTGNMLSLSLYIYIYVKSSPVQFTFIIYESQVISPPQSPQLLHAFLAKLITSLPLPSSS